jgi:chromosome segregation ATPase
MSNNQNNQRSIFWRVLRFFGCVVIIILFVAVVGAAGYFGAPLLYRQYIQPVQQHTLRLEELETRLEQNEQLAFERSEEISARLTNLEVQLDTDQEARTVMASKIESLEEQVALLTEEFAQLEAFRIAVDDVKTEQDALRRDLTSTENALGNLESDVDSIDSDLDRIATMVEDLDEQVVAIGTIVQGQDEKLEQMAIEIQMLKAMELLTRARLFLVQGNITMARTDILQARDLLFNLSSLAPEYQQETILEIVNRLDDVLEIMSQSPIAASDRLEAAWQLLVEGLPSEITTE